MLGDHPGLLGSPAWMSNSAYLTFLPQGSLGPPGPPGLGVSDLPGPGLDRGWGGTSIQWLY